MTHFAITVRFHAPYYHGEGDAGKREWPPSPLRLYQALTAAAGKGVAGLPTQAKQALTMLEDLCAASAPLIVAPPARDGAPCIVYGPENQQDDKVRRLIKAKKSLECVGDLRDAGEKLVRPTCMLDDQGSIADAPALHYLWAVADGARQSDAALFEILGELAAEVTHVGRATDMAYCQAGFVAKKALESLLLQGENWLCTGKHAENGLRLPTSGTLADLERRHAELAAGLGNGPLRIAAPLSVFRKLGYRRDTDYQPQMVAAFAFKTSDGRLRPFDSARNGLTVAGMARNAARMSAEDFGLSDRDIAQKILGHGEERGEAHRPVGKRLAYLPLPSLEWRGDHFAVGAIRRMILTTFEAGCDDLINWARTALPGQDLQPEQAGAQPLATLSSLDTRDPTLRRYLQASDTWASVTPVVLPGHDSQLGAGNRNRLAPQEFAREQARSEKRAIALVRRAIEHSGLPQTLARHAEIEISKHGFWKGTEHVTRYGFPDGLGKYPRYHVQIRWRDRNGKPVKVRGPICLGRGRYYGLGLCAPKN